MTVNVESEIAARGLSDAAVAAGSRLRVHVDIDTGLHRCGVPAEDPESIAALCRLVLDLPGLDLDGITTFRTSSSRAPMDAPWRSWAGRRAS